MNGVININKPKGFTSHDVVAKLRGILSMKKIGHTGTLDPMATGVLPIAIGHATRFIELISSHDKAYRARFILGKTTDTLDITGKLLAEKEVTAGKGKVSKPTQIANTITMEYGAALIGVEQLSSGETDRYTKASSEFVAERNKWLLVGTVVKPYNEDTEDDATDTRYIKSGDYYLDHLPAVYMRDAIISGEESSWNATFRDMDKYVVEKTVYAVKLPDQYGPYKLPAADYNFNNNTNYDPTQAHAYNFEGRFVNEANTPKYTDLAVGSYNLLVNTYPANIKASECKNMLIG